MTVEGLPGSAFLLVAKLPVTNETDGPRPAVEAPVTSAVPNRLCVECSGERGKDYDATYFYLLTCACGELTSVFTEQCSLASLY